jgi:hypothetical protein
MTSKLNGPSIRRLLNIRLKYISHIDCFKDKLSKPDEDDLALLFNAMTISEDLADHLYNRTMHFKAYEDDVVKFTSHLFSSLGLKSISIRPKLTMGSTVINAYADDYFVCKRNNKDYIWLITEYKRSKAKNLGENQLIANMIATCQYNLINHPELLSQQLLGIRVVGNQFTFYTVTVCQNYLNDIQQKGESSIKIDVYRYPHLESGLIYNHKKYHDNLLSCLKSVKQFGSQQQQIYRPAPPAEAQPKATAEGPGGQSGKAEGSGGTSEGPGDLKYLKERLVLEKPKAQAERQEKPKAQAERQEKPKAQAERQEKPKAQAERQEKPKAQAILKERQEKPKAQAILKERQEKPKAQAILKERQEKPKAQAERQEKPKVQPKATGQKSSDLCPVKEPEIASGFSRIESCPTWASAFPESNHVPPGPPAVCDKDRKDLLT